jgi:hypothetical protein
MDGNDGHHPHGGDASASRARVAVLGPLRGSGAPSATVAIEPGSDVAEPRAPRHGRRRQTLVVVAAVCVIAASLSVMGWIHSMESAPPGGRYAVVDIPPDAALPPQTRVSPQPLVPLLPPDRDAKTASPRNKPATAAPSGRASASRPSARVTGPVGAIAGYPGRCLDVPGENPLDGVPVEMTSCDGSPGELWTMASDGTVRAFGKCLTVAGDQAANGTGVQLSACHGSAGQQWRFSTGRDLVNPHADKCLDVKDFTLTNGALLQVWTCVGGPNQKWSVPA